MDSMAAIRETFFQECAEQLGELETGLLSMEDGRADEETVNAVFRAVHSIKGGAGAFALQDLVDFAHTFESTLELIRTKKVTASSSLLKTFLKAADVLADLVEMSRTDQTIDLSASRTVANELKAQAGLPGEPALTVESRVTEGSDYLPIALDFMDQFDEDIEHGTEIVDFMISLKPSTMMYRNGNDAIYLLRELGRLGDVSTACDISHVPELAEMDPEGAYFSWEVRLQAQCDQSSVEEVFEFVQDECDLQISSGVQTSIIDKSAILAAGQECYSDINPKDSKREMSGPDVESRIESNQKQASCVPEMVPDTSITTIGQDTVVAVTSPSTIRVDLERVDRLINLVGELVINQAMLSQRVFEAGIARAQNVAAGLDELEQLSREIQESVMAIRAQPVKPLFQRMARIVREVSEATGKVVRLKTEGETTEVDRTVIERLADPLTHMIRNAIDHGIEKPEVRLAAGKLEQGEIRLTAAHRSGRVVIEISDDGAGINRERVRAIAVEKGLIPSEVSLTESEIDNLLFLPGFSTANQISNISGRGVGMDVVKRSIQVLGGKLSIASRPGNGSKFSMSLPLTLAVLDGMVVKSADQTILVPLSAIMETLKPSMRDVHYLGTDGAVLGYRGGFIPLIDVGQELGFRASRSDATLGVAILVETSEGNRTALLVDEIQDQRQVVIKSLATNYGQVTGIAAATILGDGRIALILDVDAIVAGSSKLNMI